MKRLWGSPIIIRITEKKQTPGTGYSQLYPNAH